MQQIMIQRESRTIPSSTSWQSVKLHRAADDHDNCSDEVKTPTLNECLNVNFKDWKLSEVFVFNLHKAKKANSPNGLFELNRIEIIYLHLSARAQHSTSLCCLDSQCVLKMMDVPNDFVSHIGTKCSSRSSVGRYNLSPTMYQGNG